MTRAVLLLSLFGTLWLASTADSQPATPAGRQTPSSAALNGTPELPFAIDGPPPPVAPSVISRDGSGRATVRAVRLQTPLRIDGRLDEAIYETVPPMSDFIQTEPHAGDPGTEKTEVWLFFDADNVYVSFRCWESHPERMIANEMRRDSNNVLQNDFVEVIFDTFYDRRNGLRFLTNPIAARRDNEVTDGQRANLDWNPVWNVKTGRFEGGWTAEFAVPFKSLRYRPGRVQIWGFNAGRQNKWKNELSFLTRLPNARTTAAIFQVSFAATLVGVETPPGSSNVDIKPYVTSDLTSDANANPRISNDLGADFGVDLKYGITQNLTTDFTYNTDFAQVEADEQQVNLTRFSLFFPEKRDFFLENQQLFAFGGADLRPSGGQALSLISNPSSATTPILFYSRQIGLKGGRQVPIRGGARLTGRLGAYNVGVLNIESGNEPAASAVPTNFTAVRINRDVLRRSKIGAMFAGRTLALNTAGTNETYGVDGTFAFFENLAIDTYWARTNTETRAGDDTSYRAQLDYDGDRYGLQLEHSVVGRNFNPEIGYVQRPDMRRNFAYVRFSPRPRAIKSVRHFSWSGSLEHIDRESTGRLETRNLTGQFGIQSQHGDQVIVNYNSDHEYLVSPFRIAPAVTIPVGAYDFGNLRTDVVFGQQRPVSGAMSIERGTFYGGHRTALGVRSGRVFFTSQLAVEPSLSLNWVDLVQGSFKTKLVGSRVTYTMTPLMFVSALMQYNSTSHSVSTNARLRWEYRPGSELFVVYNEQRDTFATRFPEVQTRALIVKVNRLFRF